MGKRKAIGRQLSPISCVQAGPRGALHKTIREKIVKGENSLALAEAWFPRARTGVFQA